MKKNSLKNIVVYIGTNNYIEILKDVEDYLKSKSINYVNVNNNIKSDIFDISKEIGSNISKDPKENIGIIIDEYGNGGFIIASKFKGTIVAQLSDEHSAHMTKEHNNTNIISLGAKLLASEQIIRIIDIYLNAPFEGGRHMVRIDMLDEMLKGEC